MNPRDIRSALVALRKTGLQKEADDLEAAIQAACVRTSFASADLGAEAAEHRDAARAIFANFATYNDGREEWNTQ